MGAAPVHPFIAFLGVVVGQREMRRAIAQRLAQRHARSASSASVTARMAGWVPSLWMSQRSKCCKGPAFIRMSGGWMMGPAFASAPDRPSPAGSTLG